MRSQPRPARAGTTEDLLTAAALSLFGALLVAAVLVWSAGQVAGQLAHGRWPSVALADAAGIAASLPSNLADPAASWPPSVQSQLAGSALFYAVLLLMVVTVAAALAGTALVFSRVGRGQDPAVERDRAPAWGTRRQVPHLLIRRPEPGLPRRQARPAASSYPACFVGTARSS
jgi:hypothetical protein